MLSLGRLGLPALLIAPLPLLVALVMAGLASRASRRRARIVLVAGAGAIGLLSLWPTASEWRRALQYGVAISLRPEPEPWRNRDETVIYAAPDGLPLRLDVWRAPGAADHPPRPAILRLHGGAWSSGTRSDQADWDRWLNRLGYDVFDADYRLPPPARWRDEVADVKCALGWLAAHAARYGVDPDRIGLLGHSAGAHLALLAAYSSGDPRLPASCDVPEVTVRFVVNLYGPTDLSRLHAAQGDGTSLASPLEAYVGGPPPALPDRYALLSPLSHVTSRSPPTLTLHGEADRVVPVEHARLLDAALATAGVAHETYLFPWSPHGFDHQPGNIATQIARAKIQAFLARYSVATP